MIDNQNMPDPETVSVGSFFENNNICIPILQRDYAQGRDGKQHIREKILQEIKSVIDGKNMTLDFVYGYKESNVFYPLDGQQRLTTLWLTYWYLALRAKKLYDEKKTLLKFSYKTRKSSREFCKALCENLLSYSKSSEIVDYIKNQKWFFSSWQKDPTISAMLRMLGGTNGSDGIEPVFGNIAQQSRTWDKALTRFKENINFCVLEIGNDKLPREAADQLYVKMNARGKALTDFENFKADLVGEINRLFEMDESKKINFTSKLDNDWNDIFWKHVDAGGSDGKTDEVFFAFINRFCFNQLCLKKDLQSDYLLKPILIRKIDEILDENADEQERYKKTPEVSDDERTALSLYSYFSQDSNIKYTRYDSYAELLDEDNLEKLSNILDRIKDTIRDINSGFKCISGVVSQREKTDYHFLPVYKMKDGKKELRKDDNGNDIGIVEETNQKERIYFFAVCKYFESNKIYNRDGFEEWIRFCRNIIENSGVDSVAAMISVIRRINKTADSLSAYKANQDDKKTILDYLSSLSDGQQDNNGDDLLDSSEKTKINEQIDEEIRKAKKIKGDNCWEEIIKKAENTLFLCGKISFLFTDGNGQEDWDGFKDKLRKIESDFEGGRASLEFVRNYAMSYKDFGDVSEKLIFHDEGWQRRGDSWLDILTSNEYEKVHKALMNEKLDNAEDTDGYKSFVESKTFEHVVAKKGVFKGKEDLRISWFSKSYALYKKRAQNDKLVFDYSSNEYPDYLFLRNRLLKSLTAYDGFDLANNQMIAEKETYYFGDDIYFSCNNKNYFWSSNDSIYIYDRDKGAKSKKEIILNASQFKAACIIEKLA